MLHIRYNVHFVLGLCIFQGQAYYKIILSRWIILLCFMFSQVKEMQSLRDELLHVKSELSNVKKDKVHVISSLI